MSIKRVIINASAAVLTAGTLGISTAEAADKLVQIDGSSTVYPITEAVAEEFQKANKNAIKVTVGISGTGGGFKKFCRGEIDISDASRPIKAEEMKACADAGIKYIELPIAFDALTVVINPKNDWASTMTVEELKKIWEPAAQGKITTWKQVNPKWPDTKIALFGPGADSGTFEYFTDAVNKKAKDSRGDFTASEDDNVLVQGVSRDKGGLGYFGYAYYIENKDKLKAVKIDAGKGAVEPSLESVKDGTYAPLSRPIFIYVNVKSLEKPEIQAFVDFYLKNAAQLVAEVKYVPLPANAYTTAAEHVKAKKVGTVFGGKSEVGLRVEELLKREAKL
jgi:phosphate transport system substrate-binding protein